MMSFSLVNFVSSISMRVISYATIVFCFVLQTDRAVIGLHLYSDTECCVRMQLTHHTLSAASSQQLLQLSLSPWGKTSLSTHYHLYCCSITQLSGCSYLHWSINSTGNCRSLSSSSCLVLLFVIVVFMVSSQEGGGGWFFLYSRTAAVGWERCVRVRTLSVVSDLTISWGDQNQRVRSISETIVYCIQFNVW